MKEIHIGENEENQRVDRFLKKYLKNAPLSAIYKILRKDVKVNGKRPKPEALLCRGDLIELYISEDELTSLSEEKITSGQTKAKRQFRIAFEDRNILVVEKPFGLLTHGDEKEKKHTLANQVMGYLYETGQYDPAKEKIFTPAPANRLDRNTTGLILFGKTGPALQALNKMLRERGYVSKYYMTIVNGTLKKDLILKDRMEKDWKTNTVRVLDNEKTGGKLMETIARPIRSKNGLTLVEVELVTGRTHQIRAHLAKAGFPVIGDSKYGNPKANKEMSKSFGLTTQLLHSYKVEFHKGSPPLAYLEGKEILSELPPDFARIMPE